MLAMNGTKTKRNSENGIHTATELTKRTGAKPITPKPQQRKAEERTHQAKYGTTDTDITLQQENSKPVAQIVFQFVNFVRVH